MAVLGFLLLIPAMNWKGQIAYTQAASDDKPVEQVRKNIQVLKGMPDSQLFLVMNAVGDALGVHCDYCHVKAGTDPKTGEDKWLWERDDKPQKLRGREMMRMVLDLNKTNFGGRQAVTCYSCHRGALSVERVVPLPPRDFVGAGNAEKRPALPTAEQIVNRYIAAVGGRDAGAKFKTTVFKGTIERSRGRSGSLEITIKGADKYLDKITTPQGVTTRGIDGTTAWVKSNDALRPLSPEVAAASLRRLLALYDAVKVTGQPAQMTVLGTEKIGDREAYVVAVAADPGTTRKLFFDVQTGLLSRTITITEMVLSPLQEQTDFEDYRDVDGVKLPFTIRASDLAAYDTATRRFTEIRHDAAVDDAIFELPKDRKPPSPPG
jgi:hypothetical protein